MPAAATHSPTHWRLRNEARYAQRLCERTARLYRRMQTAGTFLAVLAGSAAMAASAPWMPQWAAVAGPALLASVAAALLAVKPADRALANENDVRRYAELLQQAPVLDDTALAQALAKARINDAPEIEPLRDVAYNDLVHEIGEPQLAAPLRLHQRMLAALA